MISPNEQVAFLKKLINNELPVSIKAQQMTKNIMFVEDLPNSWKLFGKTGNGFQLNHDESERSEKQIGWFVGFVSKDDRSVIFAYLIVDDEKMESSASLRARDALKTKLKEILDEQNTGK